MRRELGSFIGGLVAAALVAATPIVARGQATIRGTVFDSLLTMKPLEGATVVIHGTTHSATTDRRGHFELRGVEPGVHAIGFFHPVLDSLDIAAPAKRIDLRPSELMDIVLATPSAAGVSRILCGQPAEPSTAVLFGTVRAAEDAQPLPGALAIVRWFEVVLGPGGARQVERIAQDTTAEDGRYRLCGVPNDIALTLVAVHGGQGTGPLHLELDSLGVSRRDLLVSRMDPAAELAGRLAPDDTTPVGRVAGLSRVHVSVRNANGSPVKNAIVGIRGTAIADITDDSGRVMLTGVPAGSQTVLVRAIGLSPAPKSVNLVPGGVATLDFSLVRFAYELPSVAVVGQRGDALSRDIGRRVATGDGKLLEGDDVRAIALTPSMWAKVPGVTIGSDENAAPLMRGETGNRCKAEIWVDGMRVPGATGWELRGYMLNAKRVEVYNTAARVPPDFITPSMNACGAVLVWSR